MSNKRENSPHKVSDTTLETEDTAPEKNNNNNKREPTHTAY